MKLFIASLATETNTFAPLPTGRPAFLADYARRDGSRNPPRLSNIGLIAWRRLAEADGHEVVESLSTFAQPGGITLRAVYEDLRDALLADLEAAGPVDAVLLFMHGAMVAEGYDDCEGDTLARVRGIVGPGVPVGVELDLHCHLTETMRQAADVMVIYKEYPHTDIVARARDLYPLVIAAAEGRIRPVMAYADCRMVSLWRTSDPPVRRFVDRMSAAEGRDGILSVSFGHGFPWADVADVGAKMLVVADGDEAAAAALARSLAAEVWAMREEAATPYVTIDAAIDRALACDDPRPMVLADVADNAGAGAPSDNTAILRRLVARGVRDAASGLYWDPGAVGICREAGIGARFTLRVGGKCGVTSGDPVDLAVTVRGLADDHSQAGLSGGRALLGPSAWVEADGIHLVLTSQRQQPFDPDAFTGLGLTLHDKRLVVVKSMQHFHAAFAGLASAVLYVAAPGAVPPDFAALPLTKKAGPWWPRDPNPFGAA
ncbi:Microcystin LR degradation protein MlrC-like protein [Methylobacterium sp. 4-46]|uniref:M81 family metallopeptidase n=1 Tax=unclassified Methylobacterium TaxID=2615210 RepID=UPI000152CB47|nr:MULTISPECIES: M81 family metallopeptidase [Methylobacterium]ACA15424.1 Microcystin LR degradation protein MlrC-like protein [Methylobacterium sp. 4-46]WFT81143.1 M81 family metallopeptidase [Methylobacterium nodulans]